MNDELDNRLDELLALAVLGELTPALEAELDAALDADNELAAELDADLATAAELQSTLAEDPPPTLRAGVMAAIDALDTSPASADETPPPSGVSSPAPTPGPAVPADVVDFGAARTKRARRWQPLAAAAAVMMLLVGGVIVANRGGGDDRSDFEAIATADDSQQRSLAGTLEGTLDVVYSPSQNTFVLVGSDLPTLVDEETYQLWFVDDDGAQPVGLFRPDDTGRVEQVFVDLDPSDVLVAVTIEPAAGSESPTLPIVANT